MKNIENKFDGKKTQLEFYHELFMHHDSMLWQRFHAFITFLALLMATYAIFIIMYSDPNQKNNKEIYPLLLFMISCIVFVVGFCFHIMILRSHTYIMKFRDKGLLSQDKLSIFISDDEYKKLEFHKLLGKFSIKNARSIDLVCLIFWCGHILFYISAFCWLTIYTNIQVSLISSVFLFVVIVLFFKRKR